MQGDKRSAFRPDIEGLRAVAILTVVLYHLNLFRVSGGFIGVDVFFVISGFLITGQLVATIGENGGRALPGFYARRIKRLLPAASATLLATIVAWRIWGLITLPRATPTDAIYATFYGLNYRLAHTGTQYFNPLVEPPALQHFWSLAVEEQFYLVWPLLILAAFLSRGVRRRRNLAVALSVIGATSLYLSWQLSDSSPTWSFYGLHTRAWELATGSLVALAARRLQRVPSVVAAPLTWIGLVGIGIAAFAFSNGTTYPGVAAVLPVGGAMLVIAGGCASPSYGASLVLNLRPAQIVGRLSYSWYLWHFPIIILTPLALGHGLGTTSRIGLGVLSFGVAAVSYVVVEQPFRTRQWRPRRWFGLAVGSAALVAIVAVVAMAFPRSAVGPGPAATAPRLSGTVDQQKAQLEQAVQAGLATGAVPNNLQPDLAHAHGDGPKVSSDCFLGFNDVTVGSCVYGDSTASRTVVMFGDSSIAQWLTVADQVAKRDHWRLVLWGKASCTINDVLITNPLNLLPYRSCLAWRNETLDRIRALNPQAVIAGEFLGYGLGARTAPQWASLTIDTMKELEAPGRSVTFLMPDAMPPRDMPTCLAGHLTDSRACTIPVADAVYPTDRFAADSAALGKAGIHVVYPSRLMCADGGCPAVVGNVPVYRDSYHVTKTYSLLLAPIFEQLLPPAGTGAAPSSQR
jgi:peptidoglycan/LPS O-acetylase OafA/YrhL